MPRGYDSDISESEFEDYEDRKYIELKRGGIRLRSSGSACYTCPFCSVKGDYTLEELLQHASSVGRGLQRRSLREKARHLALKRYIRRYLDVSERSERTPEAGSSFKGDQKRASRSRDGKDGEQLFVWPWMGVVVNIPTQQKDGRRVGESGTKLRDELTQKGFEPVRVNALWTFRGHTGSAVVEFKKDWEGFKNAIMFEKHYELQHCGKRDYLQQQRFPGDKLYGWIARSDDYKSNGPIGDHLRKNGDLKSVSDKEAEDERKDSKLVSNLANTLEMKNKRIKEIENKITETTASLSKVMGEKDAMVKTYNDEIRKMQQNERDHFDKILLEHEKSARQLEAKRKALEQREKQLQQRAEQNESVRMQIHQEKKMIENATLEQKKADENVVKLAEEQKKQKQELHEKIMELERKIDAKQALELEIMRMKGTLEVMKHMGEDEDLDVKKKMDKMREELKEKEEDLDAMEELNQALVIKERKSNDELQDARKELISYLREAGSRAAIGVKRMGALDTKPFHTEAKRKFPDDEADEKALELCSQWEEYLRDPSWHPFKVITDERGESKEIINEDDEKIRELKSEFGVEVCDAVKTALKELNEYNGSGRYIIPELWNFNEQRKALLKEGVSHLLKQWKLHRRKKT